MEYNCMGSRVPVCCPPGYQGRYIVIKGDTMYLIAQKFRVSLNNLIAANIHISDPAMIYPGDVLCVPKEGEGRIPESCPGGFQGYYIVLKGDTMYRIAKSYKISLQVLIAANPHINDPNILYPGDVLCVPW